MGLYCVVSILKGVWPSRFLVIRRRLKVNRPVHVCNILNNSFQGRKIILLYKINYNQCTSSLFSQELSKETHDWYCWKCHKSGEVILCDHCPRVFHRKCAQGGTASNNKWKCPSCQVRAI